MYKLKDGDIIKILPIIKKDGSFSPVEELRGFYIGGKVIYDTPQNHLKTALKTKEFIEEMGEDNWIKSNKVPITTSRKLTIVENMINWFAAPIREEYEKAAKMKRILDKIKK